MSGERVVGERRPAGPDRFDRLVDYCRARLVEDPHVWATALFDEVARLGYDGAYSSFTRALRVHQLRLAGEPCRPVAGRPAL